MQSNPRLQKNLDVWHEEAAGAAFRSYVLMEHVQATTLGTWMDQQEGVFESDVSRIMTQVLEALSFCHANNVMHCDVKPDNILLDNNFVVKLIDFGCADLIEFGLGAQKGNGKKRMVAGGMGYLAPEVMTGRYSKQVDVWSAGCVLYELYSGFLPYPFRTLAQFKEMLAKPADLTCDPFPMIPLPAQLLAGMLERDPALRISLDDARDHAWFKRSAKIKKKPRPAEKLRKTKSEPADMWRMSEAAGMWERGLDVE
jgi:calcium-dependent protein kinase